LCSYLKQTELSFSKTKVRKLKRVFSEGWYQWEGGGYKERVKEGECVLRYENGK
jgi:hypothetical protein